MEARHPKRFALIAAALLALAPALGSTSALAADTTAEVKAAARAKGEEGLKLFEAKRWAEAYAAFQEADGLFHAPTLTLFMGHCRKNLGKLVEAKALYGKLIGEAVPRDAPEQFRKAQATARDESAALDARLASLHVDVAGPGAAAARVTVDGAPASAADLAAGLPVDPGEHAVAAEAPGVAARRTVTLAEGAIEKVTLTLAPPVAPSSGPSLPALMLGAGGVGLVLGAITGFVALGKISDIKSRCLTLSDGRDHCLISDIPESNTALTLVNTSTVALVVGGALAATGVVLLVLRPGGKPAERGGASVQLRVGPGSLALGGRF